MEDKIEKKKSNELKTVHDDIERIIERLCLVENRFTLEDKLLSIEKRLNKTEDKINFLIKYNEKNPNFQNMMQKCETKINAKLKTENNSNKLLWNQTLWQLNNHEVEDLEKVMNGPTVGEEPGVENCADIPFHFDDELDELYGERMKSVLKIIELKKRITAANFRSLDIMKYYSEIYKDKY